VFVFDYNFIIFLHLPDVNLFARTNLHLGLALGSLLHRITELGIRILLLQLLVNLLNEAGPLHRLRVHLTRHLSRRLTRCLTCSLACHSTSHHSAGHCIVVEVKLI